MSELTSRSGAIRTARVAKLAGLCLAASLLCAARPVRANPQGGTVAQGAASFSTSGSQLTVTTSGQAFINWQSFNIGAGETTTFVQPSSSSLVWNRVNDPNPSQILGTLNANGYVVLQNSSGFYVGGQASINTHGLIMTTSPIPMPGLSAGGAWEFDAPAPTAKIINYGNINSLGGAPAFLIAGDIENNGSISDAGGNISLYAGEKVLVSTSPDGRGLSAQVTLPAGSVDNQGRLVADGGSIALNAAVVNQGGLIQANSVKDVNGTIELVASDQLNLGVGSVISARGDSQGVSSGGTVTVKSGNAFADRAGSIIDVSGGVQGGNGGAVEISAPQMGPVATAVSGVAAAGFQGGQLVLDPSDIVLDSAYLNSLNTQISGGLSQISLQADHNIELSAGWTLADQSAPAGLSLSAGNDIIFDSGSDLSAGKNWSVSLSAGANSVPAATPLPGSEGIYLKGSSYLQTQDGGVHLFAQNEVVVNSGAIRTTGGGSIDVTAQDGDVNAGTSTSGFSYTAFAPYYHVVPGLLGGISTAAGGNVTITAGGDVISHLPSTDMGDAGTGAFGPEPGNVSIQAGGSVYGHYVVVNGTGTITAGRNIGTASGNVALSLVNGGWNLDAQNGDIYLQEVRNPNGIFNNQGSYKGSGYHYFDYSPQASVSLTADQGGVYLTGQSLPRPSKNRNLENVPILLPPILSIDAGPGGVNLDNAFTLFPSPDANLDIYTRDGGSLNGNGNELLMSDSAQQRWIPAEYLSGTVLPFSDMDHGGTPTGLNNFDPVILDISGNINQLNLQTSKSTQITVGGNMANCSFAGQNLHANDVTSIHVAGQIFNLGSFSWVYLPQPIQNVPSRDLPPGAFDNWQTLLSLAVNPDLVASTGIPAGADPSVYVNDVSFPAVNNFQSSFAYDATTKKLTFVGPMPSGLATALEKPLTVLVYGPDGQPVVDYPKDQNGNITGPGHFRTDTLSWTDPAQITALYQSSQNTVALGNTGGSYILGGTGQFDIEAGSISLGNSAGILSLGNGTMVGLGKDYSFLTPYIQSGASINVTVNRDWTDQNGQTISSLDMASSTIAALGGGAVTVTSLGGSMDLGSPDLLGFESQIMKLHGDLGLGIYTSGGGDVTLKALGDINVDSSRVGTFNGGNVFIESFQGNVNAGSGGAISVPINTFAPDYPNPKTPYEYVYANGIVADTLLIYGTPSSGNGRNGPPSPAPPVLTTVPGNITVLTPEGDIVASLGGILQESLNGNLLPGPTINLVAGTAPSGTSGGHAGNIDLGNSGVIGGTVNVKANGNITGLIISQQDSSVQAAQNFSGTVLSGGTANLAAGGNVSGAIIGVGGINASVGGTVSATLLGQNVSVNGGSAQSTLGTTATASSASQSAAQQSSSGTTQQLASNLDTDADKKKKKKKAQPLLERVKRVTILFPKEG